VVAVLVLAPDVTGVFIADGVLVTFELDRSSDDRGRFTEVIGVLGAAVVVSNRRRSLFCHGRRWTSTNNTDRESTKVLLYQNTKCDTLTK
jgi:hypothetical protein